MQGIRFRRFDDPSRGDLPSKDSRLWAPDDQAAPPPPPRDDALRELVDELPQPQRRIIEALFFQGLTVAALSEELGMNPQRVKALKDRALGVLRGKV